jgi:hypothetical protein
LKIGKLKIEKGLRQFPAAILLSIFNFSFSIRIWRRRWDSNPRYRYRYGGFQDRCLKPLDHSSGAHENRSSHLKISTAAG